MYVCLCLYASVCVSVSVCYSRFTMWQCENVYFTYIYYNRAAALHIWDDIVAIIYCCAVVAVVAAAVHELLLYIHTQYALSRTNIWTEWLCVCASFYSCLLFYIHFANA